MNRCIVTTSWDDCQFFDEKLSTLLLDYGISGTFYVPKIWEGRPIDGNLVRKLDEEFEIGAHTLNHPNLTQINIDVAGEEIKGSKEWLEHLVNHEIQTFSYPKGKYNKQIFDLVKNAGFNGARSLNFQIAPSKTPFLLGVGPQASNGSPFIRLKASLNSKFSLDSLIDWSVNAKLLFDRMIEKGGIWHLWGHSWEIEKNHDWEKLRSVLSYVSNKKNVTYLENRQVISNFKKSIV